MRPPIYNFAKCFIYFVCWYQFSLTGSDGIAAYKSSREISESSQTGLPVLMPRILPEEDVLKYKEIFKLQERGKWGQANSKIGKLQNPVLLGHVRAQKYLHPTKYRSRYKELLFWMQKFGDHPQAKRIYKLAKRRKPTKWKAPPKPLGKILSGNGPNPISQFGKGKSQNKFSTRFDLNAATARKQIRSFIKRGWPTGAYRKLKTRRYSKILNHSQIALIRAEIAHGYFVFGKDQLALDLANQSIAESRETVPIASWAAGLAAWRLGKIQKSGSYFKSVAEHSGASPAIKAAAAYWASRAYLIAQKPKSYFKWLERAATYEDTFYGILAHRALGIQTSFDWGLPLLTESKLKRLSRFPGGRRAFALLQLKMKEAAELELRHLYWEIPENLRPALLTISVNKGMSGLSMRIAGILKSKGHPSYYSALFPIPNWKMEQETNVDPSLIYAMVRQESQFNPAAKSARGARGLMQLMPRTAAFIGRNKSLRRGIGKKQLFDPGKNVTLGKRYIQHLLSLRDIHGDLFKMLAAYNGGPGKLRKWSKKINYQNDPLFFIESIPSRETRDFVENVLLNLWMYRLKRNEPTPSLDQVASGYWPRYKSVDGKKAGRNNHGRH